MEGIQLHLQSNVMFYVNIKNYICDLISSKALPEEEVKQALISYSLKFKSYAIYESNLDNFGYYLAGLLEGELLLLKINFVTFINLIKSIIMKRLPLCATATEKNKENIKNNKYKYYVIFI